MAGGRACGGGEHGALSSPAIGNQPVRLGKGGNKMSPVSGGEACFPFIAALTAE